ncbi:SH3 domain-containing protein [Desulfobotulus alkaliphilus]|uniref:SH3 domain-containing protein n=1 Tax=Desulfobotulus alkaliphilus TaxID=622671 RepID=A0A562RVT4_9BACT|nr:SH3 domain-containing protein [Desulfobotulus alkaliphilus]TWI73215.1 SH3 domain-containing protein [Desulfobotulus alkaliphilus]
MRIHIPVLFICLLLAGTAVMAGTLQVQTGSTPLREMPSFLAGTITNLSYGQTVEILSRQGDWRRVKVAGSKTMGWVHASALTDRKIELAAGDALSGSVSSDELALAGKGFSPEVEAAFRAENSKLNYADINRMETFRISPETSLRFLREGGLRPEGGLQ